MAQSPEGRQGELRSPVIAARTHAMAVAVVTPISLVPRISSGRPRQGCSLYSTLQHSQRPYRLNRRPIGVTLRRLVTSQWFRWQGLTRHAADSLRLLLMLRLGPAPALRRSDHHLKD